MAMIALLRREFTVERPIAEAWRHLALIEQWPSWAKHIRHVKMNPPGELGPQSTGQLYLNDPLKIGWPAPRAVFTVTEFKPHDNWKWTGSFLWLTCHYDHRFESLSPERTRLTWVIEAEGFGKSVIGSLFARIYSKNLDRAIPLLVQEMNARPVS
jgi:hypothetical protein